MQYVTFGDLRLGVRDLLETKTEFTSKAIAFSIYRDPLKAKLALFESLHQAQGGRPLAVELGNADGVHDSTGRALHYIGKAAAELKDLEESVRAAVAEVVGKVIPSLGLLKESYEDEAAEAAEKRNVLEGHRDFLEAFPFGPKHTLKSILTAHVEAGEKLGQILSKRADTVADVQNARTKEIMALRSVTIGLLNRFRQAVADEVEHNPSLPRDLESKIFTYFDQMEANRAARRGKPDAEEEEQPPATSAS
jgi:hypothetical protein